MNTENASPPQSRKKRKGLRFFLLYCLLPFYALIAIFLAAYLIGVYKPELVAQAIQTQLSDITGLPWRINGSIRPVFTPSPGISASNVLVLAASEKQEAFCDLERPFIHAERVVIYVDFSSLLSLPPRIKLIKLDTPGIHLTYDKQQRPLWLPLGDDAPEAQTPASQQSDVQKKAFSVISQAHAAGNGDVPAAHLNATHPFNGTDPFGTDGSLDTTGPSPATASFNATQSPDVGESPGANKPHDTGDFPDAPLPLGKEAQMEKQAEADATFAQFAQVLLDLPDSAFPPIEIINGSFRSYTADGEKLLSFRHIEGKFDPHTPSGNLAMSADFSLPDADLEVRFSVTATIGREGFPVRGDIKGEIGMTPPGSRTVNGNFASNFAMAKNGKDLTLPNFRIVAEGDGLSANLEADAQKMTCTGKVLLHKLSLPRWFGFGRSLPPGLQQPMDALIGEFDLFLDSDGAEAWNLRGAVGPLAVTGYVGVKDYSAPEVVVDLDLERANLDLIFPFLAKAGKYVPDPRAPEFDHPVLAPYPNDPAIPASPDNPGIEVSYDVKVRVEKPYVHDVDAGPIEVLVFPVRTEGVEKTRVSFENIAVLKGVVSGVLDIDEKSILMRYNVNNAELGLLPENQDNETRIAGRITGVCNIDMPMDEAGRIQDIWPVSVNAVMSNCDLTGRYTGGKWQFFTGTAKASGKGTIYTVISKGIRIEGLWDIAAQGIRTSWNPKGRENLTGKYNGGFFWPPIEQKKRRTRRERLTVERKGLERVSGALSLNGSLTAPIGSALRPVTGSMNTRLSWLVANKKLNLEDIRFEGFGGYCEGQARVDFSGKDVLINTDISAKMNPRTLLKAWNMLPPEGFSVPKLITGKTSIASKSGSVVFDKLKIEADGAPLTGEIRWKEGSGKKGTDPGQWTLRLTADHLNLDNYFPPDPPGTPFSMPSTTPWKLDGFKDISLDMQLNLHKVKYRQFTFSKTKVTGTLHRDRFSMHAESANFYDGKAIFLLQGTIIPTASQVSLRKGLMQMENVALGKALYDYTKLQSYAGNGDLVVDIAGNLTSNADFPSKLSGIWSINIKDGLYPAFLAKETSNLRNTFSHASASGPLTQGVIISDNFKLSGAMVDMSGGGKLNLATSEMDVRVSVTFAKVPTVPVRFYGTTSQPRMQVRGVEMVVETVQAAGVGVFTLVKNVLELPAHAIRGINSLMTKEKNK